MTNSSKILVAFYLIAAMVALTVGQKANEKELEKGLWPTVSVDRANNKSRVDVHVPLVVDMTSDTDASRGSNKLDLSVLSGMVTVNSDKSKGANGQATGPVQVYVFGIPVYSGRGIMGAMPNRLATDRSALEDLDTAPNNIMSALRKSNERFMGTLGEVLGRLSQNLRQPSTLGINDVASGASTKPEGQSSNRVTSQTDQ